MPAGTGGFGGTSKSCVSRLHRYADQLTFWTGKVGPPCPGRTRHTTRHTVLEAPMDCDQGYLNPSSWTPPPLIVEWGGSSRTARAAQTVRDRVYISERKFLAGDADGHDRDRFDCASIPVLVRDRETEAALGSARLVLPGWSVGLPFTAICPLPPGYPEDSTGEPSRFAAVRAWTPPGLKPGDVRIALVRGLLQVSASVGATHWVSLSSPGLLRLLRSSHIHLHQLGCPVEFHGTRVPAGRRIADILTEVKEASYLDWAYLTEGMPIWRFA